MSGESSFAATLLGLLLVLGLALLVVVYLLGPLGLWLRGSIQVRPEILIFDPATTEMPPDVRSYFTVMHDALAERGFEYVQTLSIPRYSTTDVQVFAVYVHREKLIGASLAAHHGKVGGKLQPARCYMTYSTEFLDGGSIGTTNMPLLTALHSRRSELRQFPEVGDAGRLLAIHEALVRRSGRVLCGPEKLAELIADPVADFTQLFTEGFRAMAERRLLRLMRGGETYRFTLWGAYYLFWSNVPPWSTVRRSRLVRQARRTIAELEREGLLESPPITRLPNA